MAECICEPIEVVVPDPIVIELNEQAVPPAHSVTADMLDVDVTYTVTDGDLTIGFA